VGLLLKVIVAGFYSSVNWGLVMRVPHLPAVKCYHARIPVVKSDGRTVILNVDRPDWESNDEILRSLGVELNVGCVGDIVCALEDRGQVTVVSPDVSVEGAFHAGERL